VFQAIGYVLAARTPTQVLPDRPPLGGRKIAVKEPRHLLEQLPATVCRLRLHGDSNC
jgi:hypothetical protein